MEDVGMKLLELEGQTQRVVSGSLSKIDVALTAWEGAKRKPKDVAMKLEYLRRSRALLAEWERCSLRGKKDGVSAAARLRDFVEICGMLDSGRAAIRRSG